MLKLSANGEYRVSSSQEFWHSRVLSFVRSFFAPGEFTHASAREW